MTAILVDPIKDLYALGKQKEQFYWPKCVDDAKQYTDSWGIDPSKKNGTGLQHILWQTIIFYITLSVAYFWHFWVVCDDSYILRILMIVFFSKLF